MDAVEKDVVGKQWIYFGFLLTIPLCAIFVLYSTSHLTRVQIYLNVERSPHSYVFNDTGEPFFSRKAELAQKMTNYKKKLKWEKLKGKKMKLHGSEDEDDDPTLQFRVYDLPDIPAEAAEKLCTALPSAEVKSNHKFEWVSIQNENENGHIFFPGCYSWRWSTCEGRISFPLLPNCGFFHLVHSAGNPEDCRVGNKRTREPSGGGGDEQTEKMHDIFLDHGRAMQLCKSLTSIPRDAGFPFQETQVAIRVAPNYMTMASMSDSCVQWQWHSCSGPRPNQINLNTKPNPNQNQKQNRTSTKKCGHQTCFFLPPEPEQSWDDYPDDYDDLDLNSTLKFGSNTNPKKMPNPILSKKFEAANKVWVMPVLVSKSKEKWIERTKDGQLCNYWEREENMKEKELCNEENFQYEVEHAKELEEEFKADEHGKMNEIKKLFSISNKIKCKLEKPGQQLHCTTRVQDKL